MSFSRLDDLLVLEDHRVRLSLLRLEHAEHLMRFDAILRFAPDQKSLQLGYQWYGREFQRTGLNCQPQI